jgi:hypothetical protein
VESTFGAEEGAGVGTGSGAAVDEVCSTCGGRGAASFTQTFATTKKSRVTTPWRTSADATRDASVGPSWSEMHLSVVVTSRGAVSAKADAIAKPDATCCYVIPWPGTRVK